MRDPFSDGWTARALTRLTHHMVRFAWAVVLVALVLSVAGVLYVAEHFAVDTDTNNMLSPDIPWRQAQIALDKAFPLDDNTIVILLEGDDLDRVDALGNRLSQRMKAEPERFGTVFDPAGSPFFRSNGLLFLDTETLSAITDELARAQPFLGAIAADPSLRGLLGVLTLASETIAEDPDAGGGLSLAPVLQAITVQVIADAKGEGGRLIWSQLIGGAGSKIMSELAGYRIIIVQPPLDFHSLRPGARGMADVREAARAVGIGEDGDVRMRLTGPIALAEDELDSAQFGKAKPELISFVLVSIISALCFRSARLSIAALITVVVGLIGTATFATATASALNLISVAFFVLFIGLAIDFGIHYGLRYREGLALRLDHLGALDRAAAGVGVALAISALCAALGFFSFLPTNYIGLQQLGFIAGFGMAIALASNLTLYPALLTVLPGRKAVPETVTAYQTDGMRAWIEANPRRILAATAVLSVAALTVVPNVRFDFDPLNLKDPNSESVQALRDLANAGRQEGYAAAFLAPSLAEAEALAARARALPEVAGAATIASFVPENQEEKLALIDTAALLLGPALSEPPAPPPTPAQTWEALDRFAAALASLAAADDHPDAEAAKQLLAALGEWRRTPRSDGDLARLEARIVAGLPDRLDSLRQSLAPQGITIDSLPEDLRRRWVTEDGRHKVEVYPHPGIAGDSAALAAFVAAVETIAPNASGAPVVIVGAGREIVAAFIQAAVTAVVAIGIALLLLLRRPRDVLISFLPPLLAALATMAASVIIDVPFNFANVIVLPLLFGLGVTAGLNLVVRERQEGSSGQMLSSCTPRAVVFSALTTISAFGTLALSSHPGIASMGLLLTIGISLTLVCAVVVLPAALTLLRPASA